MAYDRNHPYNMSTQEIDEEIYQRTFAASSGVQSMDNFRRIGELEDELARRERDHPSDWGKEIAGE